MVAFDSGYEQRHAEMKAGLHAEYNARRVALVKEIIDGLREALGDISDGTRLAVTDAFMDYVKTRFADQQVHAIQESKKITLHAVNELGIIVHIAVPQQYRSGYTVGRMSAEMVIEMRNAYLTQHAEKTN